MGFPSIDNQCGKTLAATVKHINQFKTCTHQSAGRDILGQHRGGQIKDQNSCTVLLEHWLRQLLPGRASQTDAAQSPGQPQSSQ